jgi:hypothetical protein
MRMLTILLPGCPWIPEPVEPEGSADGPETCATILYADADGDGYGDGGVAEQRCTEVGWVADDQDCDDGDAAVYPGAQESCDGVDQDCDGDTDEEPVDGEAWYPDRDGDSFGDLDGLALFCEGDAPGGYVLDATDCDDGDREVNPDAQEACDDEDVDEDCNGVADDDDPGTDEASTSGWYVDADGDGYGDMDATPEYRCDSAGGDADNADDCDDARDDIHASADETDCTDPVDYNCDGSVGYADVDGDGDAACEECDDGNADVNPSADEYCNDRDDDCDDAIDEDALDPSTWYCDADGDGFGDAACTTFACDLPIGYSALSTACDDGEIGTYPGAPEVVADGIDQDCDGGDTCYSDLDSDGYTDGSTVASADLDCEDPGEAGASTPTGDCDDTDAAANPAAIEVCDGDDDDCDGEVDEVSIYSPTWYRDADSDGYGDDGDSVEACDAPGGYVADDSDCDDDNAAVNPAGTEACNDIDDDCDGDVDEAGATGETTWYYDGDGDGYGDRRVTEDACEAPAGYVDDADDCDDGDADVHPRATESCDARDEDCDGIGDMREAGDPCSCTDGTLSGNFYVFCARAVSWDTAEALCEDWVAGASLVTVEAESENTWLGETAEELGITDIAWLGYHSVDETWGEWASGSATSYTNWYVGNPNGCGGEVDCCAQLGRGSIYAYGWVDSSCSNSVPFICKES